MYDISFVVLVSYEDHCNMHSSCKEYGYVAKVAIINKHSLDTQTVAS